MLAGGGSGVVGLVPEWIRGDVVRRPGWRRAGRARERAWLEENHVGWRWQ